MVGPQRPQGVTITHPDGTITLVELAYAGTDEHGLHVWVSMTPVGDGDRLHAELMPARTSLRFRADEGAT